jgi:hypothetical protein
MDRAAKRSGAGTSVSHEQTLSLGWPAYPWLTAGALLDPRGHQHPLRGHRAPVVESTVAIPCMASTDGRREAIWLSPRTWARSPSTGQSSDHGSLVRAHADESASQVRGVTPLCGYTNSLQFQRGMIPSPGCAALPYRSTPFAPTLGICAPDMATRGVCMGRRARQPSARPACGKGWCRCRTRLSRAAGRGSAASRSTPRQAPRGPRPGAPS